MALLERDGELPRFRGRERVGADRPGRWQRGGPGLVVGVRIEVALVPGPVRVAEGSVAEFWVALQHRCLRAWRSPGTCWWATTSGLGLGRHGRARVSTTRPRRGRAGRPRDRCASARGSVQVELADPRGARRGPRGGRERFTMALSPDPHERSGRGAALFGEGIVPGGDDRRRRRPAPSAASTAPARSWPPPTAPPPTWPPTSSRSASAAGQRAKAPAHPKRPNRFAPPSKRKSLRLCRINRGCLPQAPIRSRRPAQTLR